MNEKITDIIPKFSQDQISENRKKLLKPLIEYIQQKKDAGKTIRLHFICTHNSRRSHLSQIWAQTMAFHFRIKDVSCFSGGTEATAVFPQILETLSSQGYKILKLSEGSNPVYALKFNENGNPIIAFSKKFNDKFNPQNEFCAVMTCSSADTDCPFIPGAECRVPLLYEDPKLYDETELMGEKYRERSLEIAREMWFVFGSIE